MEWMVKKITIKLLKKRRSKAFIMKNKFSIVMALLIYTPYFTSCHSEVTKQNLLESADDESVRATNNRDSKSWKEIYYKLKKNQKGEFQLVNDDFATYWAGIASNPDWEVVDVQNGIRWMGQTPNNLQFDKILLTVMLDVDKKGSDADVCLLVHVNIERNSYGAFDGEVIVDALLNRSRKGEKISILGIYVLDKENGLFPK